MPFLGFSNSCISLKILYFPCACNFISKTSRGEGFTKQSFIWGGHALRYSDPSPFVQCIPFLTEKLHVPLLHSFCPFHIHVPPCNLQLCKFMYCLFKKYEQLTKPEHFLNFFTAINAKCICWPFWPCYRPKWQISLPLHMLELKKSVHFHNLRPEKPLLTWPVFCFPSEFELWRF